MALVDVNRQPEPAAEAVSAPEAALGPRKVERRRAFQRYTRDLYLIDTVAVSLSAAAAHWLRFGFDDASISFWATSVPYGLFSLVVVVAWLGLLRIGGAYDESTVGFGAEEYRRIVEVGMRLVAVVAIAAFALNADVARGFVASLIPLTVVATLLGRWWSRRWLHRRRTEGSLLDDVLAVGPAPSLVEMEAMLAANPQAGYRVAQTYAVAGDDEAAHLARVLDLARSSDVDVVAIAADAGLSPRAMRSLSWQLADESIQLMITPRLSDLVAPRVKLKPVAGVPLLTLGQPRLSGAAHLVKGLFDRTVALVWLIALSPLLAVIAVAIKRDSEGPALFTQPRLGLNGQWFTVYKFRTMTTTTQVTDSDNEVGGLFFKMRQDPRITPLGAKLRRYSLDELPQLWNVLKGDMSIVGPRPLPDAGTDAGTDVGTDDDLEATARRRVLVKPGLTGLWQVNGRSDLSWDQSIRHDLYYVENWSLALDGVILFKTLTAVVRGDGAY